MPSLCLANMLLAQNVVLSVYGDVRLNGILITKGDNLSDKANLKFNSANADVKLLTRSGICFVKQKDKRQQPDAELLELIKQNIFHYSVVNLATTIHAPTRDPTEQEQISEIDSLCKKLGTTTGSVYDDYNNYIIPYCAYTFQQPYWKAISAYLSNNYGYKYEKFRGDVINYEELAKLQKMAYNGGRDLLPDKASLKNYCPLVRTQGLFGTCAAWASSYAAHTISWAVNNDLHDVEDITNNAFSPLYLYLNNKSLSDAECQTGLQVQQAANFQVKNGDLRYSEMAVSGCTDQIADATNLEKFRITDWSELYNISSDQLDNEDLRNQYFNDNIGKIEQSIVDGKPVIAGIYIYQSFENPEGDTWDGSLTNKQEGSHAICIIGYDKNYNNQGESAVEIMNSWGPEWANNGFIWIKYKDLKNILVDAINQYDPVTIKPKPLEVPKPHDSTEIAIKPVIFKDEINELEGSFNLITKGNDTMVVTQNGDAIKQLNLTSNEQMTYNVNRPYSSGTHFRLYINTNREGYIYLISTDSSKSGLNVLFPDSGSTISPLINSNLLSSIIVPPTDTSPITMDEHRGEDYLCILWSKEPLDIATIASNLRSRINESFVKIVKEYLGDKIVDEKDIVFSPNEIKFTAKSKDKTVVPIFIKIIHQ